MPSLPAARTSPCSEPSLTFQGNLRLDWWPGIPWLSDLYPVNITWSRETAGWAKSHQIGEKWEQFQVPMFCCGLSCNNRYYVWCKIVNICDMVLKLICNPCSLYHWFKKKKKTNFDSVWTVFFFPRYIFCFLPCQSTP